MMSSLAEGSTEFEAVVTAARYLCAVSTTHSNHRHTHGDHRGRDVTMGPVRGLGFGVGGGWRFGDGQSLTFGHLWVVLGFGNIFPSSGTKSPKERFSPNF